MYQNIPAHLVLKTSSQMIQIVLGFSTQLSKENKSLLMTFMSLFCTSADPSVTDFLLTHPVFMPCSQLCAALQHQYPAATRTTDFLLYIDISLCFTCFVTSLYAEELKALSETLSECFLILNLHLHLPSGAIRRYRPGEGSICSQHQAEGCETGGSLGGSVRSATEGQSCGF